MASQRKKLAAIGVKASNSGFIEPALATLIEKAPSGDRWIHEGKGGRGLRAPSILQGFAGGAMNWNHIARHAAIAIGLTFVLAATVVVAVRLLVLDF
jgi:hypothetical protein